MAIKGKGRSKARPAPRAPRRSAVPVPVPFHRRRWVQVTAAFLLGIAATAAVVWIVGGLRADDAEAEEAARAAERRTAAASYQQAVRAAFSAVATVEPGVPPDVLPEMDAALEAMASGKAPAGSSTTFEDAERAAERALRSLRRFDVAEAIRNRGFDPLEASFFTTSASELAASLDLYRQAAAVARVAAASSGEQQRQLAAAASDLRASADEQLATGWGRYLEAVRVAGIEETPGGGLVPELPGGGG